MKGLRQAWAVDERGRGPLHQAAARGGVSEVRDLLSFGADPLERSSSGTTPLHEAAACGNTECLAALAAACHDPDPLDDNGATPARLAVTYDRVGCLKVLLDVGAAISKISAGRTPVAFAVSRSSPECALLLLARGAKPGAADRTGRHALHWAAANDLAGLFPALVAAGCEIDALDSYGMTPLALAAVEDRPAAFLAALAQGAGANPGYDAAGLLPVHHAAMNPNPVFTEALIGAGADVSHPDAEGVLPLMLAARCGNAGNVARLANAGADPEAMGRCGRTALDVAAGEAKEALRAALAQKHAAELNASLVKPSRMAAPSFSI